MSKTPQSDLKPTVQLVNTDAFSKMPRSDLKPTVHDTFSKAPENTIVTKWESIMKQWSDQFKLSRDDNYSADHDQICVNNDVQAGQINQSFDPIYDVTDSFIMVETCHSTLEDKKLGKKLRPRVADNIAKSVSYENGRGCSTSECVSLLVGSEFRVRKASFW